MSCSLIYAAEKIDMRIIRLSLLVIAIIIPAFLAGFRNLSIGTDVMNYVQPMYLSANVSKNFFSYLQVPILHDYMFVPISTFEVGYTALVFICTKIFGNIFSVLFLTQVLIIGGVLAGLWKFREKISVWIGMLIYYLIFYNISLNMVRQSIAMSIIIFAFPYLYNKEYIKYIILIVIAVLFHKTAIIGLIIMAIYFIYTSDNNMECIKDWKGALLSYNKNNFRFIIMTLISFCIVFIPQLLKITLKVLGVSSYADGYINGNASFSLNQIIMRIPLLLIFFICYRKISNNKLKLFFFSMIVCDLASSQLASTSTFASRISLYFMIFYVYIIPYCLNQESIYIKNILILFLIMYLLVYWYYNFVYLGYNETIPYVISSNFNLD